MFDLKSLALRIAAKGSVLEGTVSAPLFVSSAKQLTSTIADISDDVLEKNYKQFVKVLEGHLATKKLDKLTSKDLIKDFLSTELKLYSGIEITLHSICAAAVKISVERVVDSLVSRYKKHLKVDRQMDEKNAEEEISENGPLLQNADTILKNAMNNYWKEHSENGAWHL